MNTYCIYNNACKLPAVEHLIPQVYHTHSWLTETTSELETSYFSSPNSLTVDTGNVFCSRLTQSKRGEQNLRRTATWP